MKQFEELPIEVQEKMMDYQEIQGNKRDPDKFRPYLDTDKDDGGFDWDKTPEGIDFWEAILNDNELEVFWNEYPKLKSH